MKFFIIFIILFSKTIFSDGLDAKKIQSFLLSSQYSNKKLIYRFYHGFPSYMEKSNVHDKCVSYTRIYNNFKYFEYQYDQKTDFDNIQLLENATQKYKICYEDSKLILDDNKNRFVILSLDKIWGYDNSGVVKCSIMSQQTNKILNKNNNTLKIQCSNGNIYTFAEGIGIVETGFNMDNKSIMHTKLINIR
jgi:hypothetical protein